MNFGGVAPPQTFGISATASDPIPVGPTPRSRVAPAQVFYRQKHRLEGPESGLIALVGVEVTQGHETWTRSGKYVGQGEMHEPLRKQANEDGLPWSQDVCPC